VIRFRSFSKIAWDQSLYGALDLKTPPMLKKFKKVISLLSLMRAKVVHLIYYKGNPLMTSFLLETGLTCVPESIENWNQRVLRSSNVCVILRVKLMLSLFY